MKKLEEKFEKGSFNKDASFSPLTMSKKGLTSFAWMIIIVLILILLYFLFFFKINP